MSSSSNVKGSLPFALDETVPARQVSFGVVQQFAAVLALAEPLRYSQMVEKPVALLDHAFNVGLGKSPSRTTRYHHWNALRILGLIRQLEDGYVLTETGKELADTSPVGAPQPLNERAQKCLRAAVVSSDLVRRNFLALFTGDPADWTQGPPLGIEPLPRTRAVRLHNPLWPAPLQLTVRQTYGILWGLAQWCRTLVLVDEILIRPQADVQPERASILFPVMPDKASKMTDDEFDALLRPYLKLGEPAANEATSLSIPLLFYRLCPAAQIPLAVAKEFLIRWLRRQANRAWVQAPSYESLRAEKVRRGSSEAVWQKRQEAFLIQDGVMFTKLLVSAQLGAILPEPHVPWPGTEQEGLTD